MAANSSPGLWSMTEPEMWVSQSSTNSWWHQTMSPCGPAQSDSRLQFCTYLCPVSTSVSVSAREDQHWGLADLIVKCSTCHYPGLRDCLKDVSFGWKSVKLNAGKTKFLIIGGTPMQCRKCDQHIFLVRVSQSIILASSVLNRGVTFDENLNFKHHIEHRCHCCFYHIHSFLVDLTFRSLNHSISCSTAIPILQTFRIQQNFNMFRIVWQV